MNYTETLYGVTTCMWVDSDPRMPTPKLEHEDMAYERQLYPRAFN